MDIKSYNRIQSNISSVGSYNSVNQNADTSVTKVSPIKGVTHGFNPANLYLLQLNKSILKDEYSYSKEEISKMDFDEFEEYLNKFKNNMNNNIDTELSLKGLNTEQILLLQDLFLQEDDENNLFSESKPLKNEETENLFYYKKATNGYEKSYQNMAEISSEGLIS